MPAHDHIFDAIDLVWARLGGQIDAEAELIESRDLDNEVCQRQMLFAQTRVAAMLVRSLGIYEGRTPREVLDSLIVAVMEVDALTSTDDSANQ